MRLLNLRINPSLPCVPPVERIFALYSMVTVVKIKGRKGRNNKTPRNIDNNGEAEWLCSCAQCLVFLIFRGLTFRVMPDILSAPEGCPSAVHWNRFRLRIFRYKDTDLHQCFVRQNE